MISPFQKLPHLKLIQNHLRSSSFLCLELVNNFSILYYNYLKLNDFLCYYRDPINSILKETLRKCSQKLLFRIYSNTPYFHLKDFAKSSWNDQCKQYFDRNTYSLRDCSLHQFYCLICCFVVLTVKLNIYSYQTSKKYEVFNLSSNLTGCSIQIQVINCTM